MKLKIKFSTVTAVIFLFTIAGLFPGCKEQPAKNNELPGYLLPTDLRDTLPADVIGKMITLNKEMNKGKDPSFENVSGIFPKMKYPPTLVGVKEHMGKYLITWDGVIVCPPLHISFKVGKDTIPFGRVEEENVSRSLLDDYLPVVTTSYKYDGLAFEETVFGYSKDFLTENPQLASVRMKVMNSSGEKKDTKLSVCLRQVEGRTDVAFREKLRMKNNGILDKDGKVIFWSKQTGGVFEKNNLTYDLSLNPGDEKEFYFHVPHLPVSGKDINIFSNMTFDEGLKKVRVFWKDVVESGMQINVPEDIVNNAYKTWLINNFLLAEEDKSRQHYEVHDAPIGYEHVYGFAASMWLNTLTTRGYFEEAKKCADLFIRLQRPHGGFSGERFIPHQNGSIIYTISQLYRMNGDDKWFRTVAPHVIDACNMIIDDRSKSQELVNEEKPVTYGLLSEFRYCEDGVGNSTIAREYLGNAWCWAGLNQASIALGELGGEYEKESVRLKKAADEYRSDIFASMEKAKIEDENLTFLPMVVNNTTPFKTLQESTLSHYYNILSPRMLESEIFDIDDEKIYWVPKFLEQRDGLVLGLTRWLGFGGIDPHFVAGYALTNLRLNEIDKYLLTFYSLISYGMARETYSTNEHWFIVTGTSNYGNLGETHWLSARQPHLHSTTEMIRLTNMMLLKEEKNEVWLAWGTPRKWLEDGKKIELRKAQTCFGTFDVSINSHVSEEYINTELTTSLRKSPSVIRLKLRHPEGKKIKKVEINGKQWNDFKGEVINIYPEDGNMSVIAYY